MTPIKIFHSKRKVAKNLYERDILTSGKTDSLETYEELLDEILTPTRVRKNAPIRLNTVYVQRRSNQPYDIHYRIDPGLVEGIRNDYNYRELWSALRKTLNIYKTKL